jgi:predicted enzyme related to lactoylglutathione lyase
MEMTSYPDGTPSWIDIGVPDMDDAIAFYGGLFGWEFDEPGDDETYGGYRQARVDGAAIAGFGPQMAPGAPFWSTYVATSSVEATAERVTAAGGTVVMPAMDIPEAGRMAVFTDDAGTFFSVWEAGGHPGAQRVNEPGTLTWNELTTREPAKAKAFYGSVFGWGANDNPMGPVTYTEWQLDGRTIGGMMPMEGDMWPADLPNHWMVYFGVADTDEACGRVAELGGSVSVPPFDIPAGRIAVVNDRAGAAFSLIALAVDPPSAP